MISVLFHVHLCMYSRLQGFACLLCTECTECKGDMNICQAFMPLVSVSLSFVPKEINFN